MIVCLSFFSYSTSTCRTVGYCTREAVPGCQGVPGAGKYSKSQHSTVGDNCFVDKGRAGC